jgi:hypothetical protein
MKSSFPSLGFLLFFTINIAIAQNQPKLPQIQVPSDASFKCNDMVYEVPKQDGNKIISIKSIRGTVKDLSDAWIPGACIGLFSEPKHTLAAVTKSLSGGYFEINSLPEGDYRFVVKYNGFCAANAKIRVDNNIVNEGLLYVHMTPPEFYTSSYVSETAQIGDRTAFVRKDEQKSNVPELKIDEELFSTIANNDWRELNYRKWHKILANDPIINDIQFWFDTEHNSNKEYVTTLNDMLRNKYDMLDYLCNRIAEAPSPNLHTLYADVALLDKLGGVCLHCGVTYEFGVDNRISFVQNVPTFQKEWHQGLYKSPDKLIAQLCKDLMKSNEDRMLDGNSLAPLFRFGIFAAPELIRQVKKNNSNYAFAALLRIMERKVEIYPDKGSKLEAISKWYKDNKDSDHTLGIMKTIGKILGK